MCKSPEPDLARLGDASAAERRARRRNRSGHRCPSFVMFRVVSGTLSMIAPVHPATVVAVGLLLAGVALTASWLPARRAARIEPVRALGVE